MLERCEGEAFKQITGLLVDWFTNTELDSRSFVLALHVNYSETMEEVCPPPLEFAEASETHPVQRGMAEQEEYEPATTLAERRLLNSPVPEKNSAP
jgi:hypothetical protein